MNTKITPNDYRIYTKTVKSSKDIVNITLRTIALEEILTSLYNKQTKDFIFIKSSNTVNINYYVIQEKKKNLLYTALNLKYTFKPLFLFCLDYFLYKNIKSFNSIISFASLFSPLRINIFVKLFNKKTLPTLSSLFINVIWLEREIIDFSNITIYNLKDTRRLMLDYLQKRQHPHQLLIYDYTYNHFINDLYTIKW